MPSERDLADEAALYSRNNPRSLEHILTLGLCAFYKCDKAYHWMQQNNAAEIAPNAYFDIANNFTHRELDDYRRTARDALEDYRNAGRGWWYGFSQSLAAAFAYSVLLVLAALIIKVLGSDLATVVNFIFAGSDQ